ncbi:MAG: hypothetical protein KA743_05950 [Geothrix sp.]|nr:hypothetical protein [Geothrix sp.]
MRFLLDTNVLITLEDSSQAFSADLADFVRLAQGNGHELTYHEASHRDFDRDLQPDRRQRNLDRIRQFRCLTQFPACPWNDADTTPNDAVDNEILFAMSLDAADYVVTEDRPMLRIAQRRDLKARVMAIQEAAQFLRQLHDRRSVKLPNIEEVPLYSLVPALGSPFFDSLRASYDFDTWFRAKAKEGRHAWIHRDDIGALGGLCIYAEQVGEIITDGGQRLEGKALKLCTFKVAETHRGRKIGELFLKAAFTYATANRLPNVFITARQREHLRLVEMLVDFGFEQAGVLRGDDVLVKAHPVAAPGIDLPPVEYARRFFPHVKDGPEIGKYIVPIQHRYHQILFPDFRLRGTHDPLPGLEMAPDNPAGNAIKLAYLCHAKIKGPGPGDLVLFYRSQDQHRITTLGMVEVAETCTDPDAIARLVRRRTVYSMAEIEAMSDRPVKVMLFRAIRHLPTPPTLRDLTRQGILKGAPQTIVQISHTAYEKLQELACV